MKFLQPPKIWFLGFFLLPVALPLAIQAQEDDAEDIFELSPFSIEASEDDGYMATTTLAGSRVRTSIRDIGASISIVTQEYMEDIGATDGESLLGNIGNVEVGGSLGNFANSDGGNVTSETRENPQRAQRIRGLVSAITTRDYFQTDIPFDSYNTSRITINRGPNSILFGLGSPGGVINNTTSRAQIGTDNGQLRIRVDHRGGHRESLNVNKTIIEDRLALRVGMLNEKIKWKQEPANEVDQRFFVAWDSVLFENEGSSVLGKTRFRGSIETGEINRNAPDVIPPTDGFSSWWNGLGSQADVNRILASPGVDFTDINNAALTSQQVLAAISAGEPITDGWGGTAEAFAALEGQFVPRQTVNRFGRGNPLGNDPTEGGRNSSVQRVPYFLYPAINYNTHNDPTQGWNDPEMAGIQGVMGRFRAKVNFPNGSKKNITQDVRWTNAATGGTGFLEPSLNNRDIFDYHNLNFLGTTSEVTRDFQINTFYLEQEFLDGAIGLEIAYDEQTEERFTRTPFDAGRDKTIFIDISQNLASGDANFDSIPDRHYNENVGRPVTVYLGTVDSERINEQDTFRATLYGNLDFSDYVDGKLLGNILGDHTLTGLYEDRDNYFWQKSYRGSWWADNSKWPGSADISNGLSNNFRRVVRSQIYLGPDTRGFSSASDVRIDGFLDISREQFPQIGDEYGVWYFDNKEKTDKVATWRIIENVVDGNTQLTNLESTAYSLNSRFLGGHIVGMYANRTDEQTVWQRIQENTAYGDSTAAGVVPLREDRPGIQEIDGSFNLSLLELEPEPATNAKDDTTTWSVVGKFPEFAGFELPFGMDLYGHYYEAESFVPAGISNNVLGQQLASPFGITEEYGFTIELFEQRLAIRFNKFETASAFNRTNLGGALGQISGRIDFYLDRITSAENDTATTMYPEGFNGFGNAPDPGSDATLTPDTVPDNRQRRSGTGADLMGFTTWDQYYGAIIDAVVPELQAVKNHRIETLENGEKVDVSDPIRGLNSTQDFVATGTEIDIVGRLTDNLSISLNFAEQTTVTSNTGPVAIPLAFEQAERLQRPISTSPGGWALWSLRGSPFQVESDQIGARYENQVLRILRIQQGLDGTQNPEQRKYRFNGTVRYDFTEGRLKGLQVGATARYQDKVSGGYPNMFGSDGVTILPDIANAWFGPDSIDGDLFLRYRKSLTDKIDWTIQLNARNLYRSNGAEDIPVSINPDGTVAIIRVPVEQQYFLSNTFSF